MPTMNSVDRTGLIHLDAFCDRVRAEAPIELGGARRHDRAGVRSKTEAAIAGQGVMLAQKETGGYYQACN